MIDPNTGLVAVPNDYRFKVGPSLLMGRSWYKIKLQKKIGFFWVTVASDAHANSYGGLQGGASSLAHTWFSRAERREARRARIASARALHGTYPPQKYTVN